MTPADLLRTTAADMLAVAEAAPAGPWTVELLGERGYPQRITNDRAILIATTYDMPPPGTVAGGPVHIAAWNPQVALAVAWFLQVVGEQYSRWPVEVQETFRKADPAIFTVVDAWWTSRRIDPDPM